MTDLYRLNVLLIMTVLAAAMLLAFVRVAWGPSLADRVVALDLIAVTGVALMVTGGLLFEDAAFLDIGLLLAVIGFVGTAAFAGYIERGGRP
jgi:multisubunit Na+/H+ antiporter MnhF subunit